jgi:hypothetical protein
VGDDCGGEEEQASDGRNRSLEVEIAADWAILRRMSTAVNRPPRRKHLN